MTLIILLLLMMTTMSFLFFNSPLMLACLVILIAMGVSMITYLFTSTSWLSFIIFMIFVSAMMVIFIYVASLTSNDFLTTYPSMSLFLVPLFSIFFFLVKWPFNSMNELANSTNQQNMSEVALTPLLMLKIYSPYTLTMSFLLIIYLLVVLIAVAKNSSTTSGPLRAL
nr:TPA_asm: ND6 [Echinogammarus veneris]